MPQVYKTDRITKKIDFQDPITAMQLFGNGEANLRLIEKQTGVTLLPRGTELTMAGLGLDVAFAERVLRQLYRLAKRGMPLYGDDVKRALAILSGDENADLQDVFMDKVFVSVRNKVITPRGLNQKIYVEQIRHKDMVFGIGPAGTGKTYLAMAMAVSALLKKQVRKIILTRPAVEAGEKLGFLPGDLAEKVNPYLRPLYDALNDLLDYERAANLLEQGAIEVAPLAFMRGRTLNNGFIILDEAQNTTCEQMKMFLTRLGFGSKAVITGDITQIDLPHNTYSGLVMAQEVLHSVPGIGIATFTEADVVRHPLVQKVVKAFERHEQRARELQPANHRGPGTNGGRSPANNGASAPPAPSERPPAPRRVEIRDGGAFPPNRVDRDNHRGERREEETLCPRCGAGGNGGQGGLENQREQGGETTGAGSHIQTTPRHPTRNPDTPDTENSPAATG